MIPGIKHPTITILHVVFVYTFESLTTFPSKHSPPLLLPILEVTLVLANLAAELPLPTERLLEKTAFVDTFCVFIEVPGELPNSFGSVMVLALVVVGRCLFLALPLQEVVHESASIDDGVLTEDTLPIGFVVQDIALVVIAVGLDVTYCANELVVERVALEERTIGKVKLSHSVKAAILGKGYVPATAHGIQHCC